MYNPNFSVVICTISSPLKICAMRHNEKISMKTMEPIRVKTLGDDINNLINTWNVFNKQLFATHFFSNKMRINFNMFGVSILSKVGGHVVALTLTV